MTERARSRVPWAVWGGVLVLLAATLTLSARNGSINEDPLTIAVFVMMMLGYVTVGAVVASRLRPSLIGWLMIVVGGSFLIGALGSESAIYAFRTSPGSLPVWLRDAALVVNGASVAVTLAIPLILALFPTGRVPSARWRWYPYTISGAVLVVFVGSVLRPGRVDVARGVQPPNPLGVEPLRGILDILLPVAGVALIPLFLLSVVMLVARFRRARGEERQQIRWLAYVAVLGVVALIALIVTSIGLDANESSTVNDAAFLVFLVLIGLGVPAAIGVALLRYRLWDLDVVVKKTVIAAIVIMLITIAALAALALLGGVIVGPLSDSPGATLIAGVAIGLLFWPLQRVARKIADRVVYGGRATPYEVLSDFSDRMAETYSTDDVLPRMAAIVAAGTRAERVGIWLLVGREMQAVAEWPLETKAPDAAPTAALTDLDPGSFEVRHQGELLGAVTVSMPAADPMNPSKERLIRDLASQAGLVLRNVRLIEELRASRRRIVAAQDERAKTLERNIHDGAQQQLVALAVKLRLAETLAGKDPARVVPMLADLQREANDTLENLRDLARGIYPPLLADKGLTAALEAQARKMPIPVALSGNGLGRFVPEIESTIYFCCLEALQNITKYAHASGVDITLSAEEGLVHFRVTDDGVGFELTSTPSGTGLRGMADRVEAVGGTLEVGSEQGRGTTINGSVPATPLASTL